MSAVSSGLIQLQSESRSSSELTVESCSDTGKTPGSTSSELNSEETSDTSAKGIVETQRNLHSNNSGKGVESSSMTHNTNEIVSSSGPTVTTTATFPVSNNSSTIEAASTASTTPGSASIATMTMASIAPISSTTSSTNTKVTKNSSPVGSSSTSPKLVSIADNLARRKPPEVPPPTCQNCQTNTTPLWRRDDSGQVLCNACGLFLKLHGRPRPISLKTDVIKSRNRIRNVPNTAVHDLKGQDSSGEADLHKKSSSSASKSKKNNSMTSKDNYPPHLPPMPPMDQYGRHGSYWTPLQYGHAIYNTETGYPHISYQHGGANGHIPVYPNKPGVSGNGGLNGVNGAHQLATSGTANSITVTTTTEPNSRTGTTVLDQLSAAASASPYLHPHQPESDTRIPRLSPTKDLLKSEQDSSVSITSKAGSVSPLNDKLDDYQGLKSRVTELELVNDLYKSRISELENLEAAARKSELAIRESELALRASVTSLENRNRTLEQQVNDLHAQIKRLNKRNIEDGEVYGNGSETVKNGETNVKEESTDEGTIETEKTSQWAVINKSPKTRKKMRVSDIL